MPQVLTKAQVEQFREEGYVFGIPIITPKEAADESKAIHLELEPGEMSLHANGVVHGSDPNTSDRPRIGWTLVCTRPDIRPGVRGFVSGTVLAGRNDERIYANEPIPASDFDPVAVAAYDRAMEGPVKLYKPK